MSAHTTSPLHARLAASLRLREADLRRILVADEAGLQDAANDAGVSDFKDIAAGQALAAVDDIQAAHASAELKQVLAALRRLEGGTYGACQDCGKAIAELRLQALPSAALCTSCQARHER